jgi:hypothetical protein
MLVGGGCSGKSCSVSIRNSAEKGISQRENCQVFVPELFEIRRAPQEIRFFCSGDILFTQSTMRVLGLAHFSISCLTGDRVLQNFELTLNKSTKVHLRLLSVFYFPKSKIKYRRSKNCSAGNPPPF